MFFFGNGSHRTNGTALPTLHTNHLIELGIEGRANAGFETTTLSKQGTHALNFVAHIQAAAALNAFSGIANQGVRRLILFGRKGFARVGNRLHPHLESHLLQFAVVVAHAGFAIRNNFV